MNIYFAGVPAGNQAKREHHLVRIGMQNRLVTFYYERQAGITLDNFVPEEGEDGTSRILSDTVG